MSNNVVSIDKQEDHSKSDDLVMSKLIAIGANYLQNSYEDEKKNVYSSFVKSSLGDIIEVWPYLENKVKVDIIDSHYEEFKKFVQKGV